MIKYVGKIMSEDPSSEGGFNGALTLPKECFDKDCSWYAVAEMVPSDYDTSDAATYGRIPKVIFGFTHGETRKYIIVSHTNTPSATMNVTQMSDGSLKHVGDSSKRFYKGIGYDLYIATPSWG